MQRTADALPRQRPGAPRLSLRVCARASVASLIVLSIVVPTMFQPLKATILAVALACMALSRETWTSRSSPAQAGLDLAALAYCTVGLAWALYGLQRGNPGAGSMMTVHAAYPVLCIFLARLTRPGDFAKVSAVVGVSGVLVVASQLLFIASFFGLDDGYLFAVFQNSLQDVPAAVDAGEDYLLFTLPSVSSLLFLAPWLIAYALLAKNHKLRYGVLLMATLALLVLAGRRAFLLGIFFGGLAILGSSRELAGGPTTRLRPSGILIFLAVSAALAIVGFESGWLNVEILTDRLTSILDFSDNDSNLERRLQFASLMEGIAAHPLFGSGLGAAASYLRSDTQPWAYELSYVALMFQVGLLGFFVYAIGVVFVLVALRRLGMAHHLPESERLAAIAFLGGLVSFLIVNATNPYLAKFDYMWTLFVPLAMIRAHLGGRRQAARTAAQCLSRLPA